MNGKYIIGGIIIVVFMGVMIYLFTQTNVTYENNFTKIRDSHVTIKATGYWVKEKNYHIDKERNLFSFYITDGNGEEMKVIYKGTIPNNFESATSVVITGKYNKDYFHATDILTKCPSKYETKLEESV